MFEITIIFFQRPLMDDKSRKRTDDNGGRKQVENVKKAEVAVSRPLPTPAPLDLRMFDDVSYVPPKKKLLGRTKFDAKSKEPFKTSVEKTLIRSIHVSDFIGLIPPYLLQHGLI